MARVGAIPPVTQWLFALPLRRPVCQKIRKLLPLPAAALGVRMPPLHMRRRPRQPTPPTGQPK